MEKDSHKLILRAVNSESSEKPPEEAPDKAPEKVSAETSCKQQTGIILKNVEKRRCSVCNELVCFEGAAPLSMFECPLCGNKIMVPGKVDNFILHSHIGEGEMGTIFKATDESLDREVAIKVVRTCHADDPAHCERLRREACAAGKLNHPRVAQVYALNFSNGYPYLVMELVAGLDFSEKLEKEGPLKETDVLRMALDVADGLSALHRESLVHGDIKPANIVLDRDGNAKLVDFGLSGMMRHDGHGNLVGTPYYLAPEILRGAPDSHRTDIFSLGCTLYYLLSGKLPFDGGTLKETLMSRLTVDPPPLGEIAPGISEITCNIVMRMMARDPEKRYANSDDLADDVIATIDRLENPVSEEPDEQSVPVIDLPEPPVNPVAVKLSKPRLYFLLALLVIAIFELGIEYKQQTVPASWRWMKKGVGGLMENAVALVHRGKREKSTGPVYEWKSVTMGSFIKRASTMQFGDKLILQSSGKDMWSGSENYRFFKVDCAGNYSFTVKVLEIAENSDYDISGILIKNQSLDDPSGLLFGFLGSGHLFLQVRGRDKSVDTIKCVKNTDGLPVYLKIRRDNEVYTLFTSSNETDWSEFASYEMDLKDGNAVGVAVSSQKPEEVASAKFSSITLRFLPAHISIQTNSVADAMSVATAP